MGPFPPLNIVDPSSIALARDQVWAGSLAAGLATEDAERLADAAVALAQNQLTHALGGRVTLRRIERDGVPGVELEASDDGPGIADPAGSVEGGAPLRGLAAVRRVAGELDLDVRLGEGTTVVARRFAEPCRRQPEVAVFGRGLDNPSGDVAVVHRTSEHLMLVVVDGAGHGPLAREAADLAAAAVTSTRPPLDVLRMMHEALKGSRGAAATLAWIDRARTVTLFGVGNVRAAVVEASNVRGFLPQAGMLGRGLHRAPPPRIFDLPPHASLVLFTDGVASSPGSGDVAGRSPIHVAQRLLTPVGVAHDDALVLVAR